MPNGRTHDIISLVLSPVVIGVTYLITKNIKTTAIIFSCYFFAAMKVNYSDYCHYFHHQRKSSHNQDKKIRWQKLFVSPDHR